MHCRTANDTTLPSDDPLRFTQMKLAMKYQKKDIYLHKKNKKLLVN